MNIGFGIKEGRDMLKQVLIWVSLMNVLLVGSSCATMSPQTMNIAEITKATDIPSQDNPNKANVKVRKNSTLNEISKEVSKYPMSIQIIFDGIEVTDTTFGKYENNMEILLYASYQEQGSIIGPVVSTFLPTDVDYYPIRKSEGEVLDANEITKRKYYKLPGAILFNKSIMLSCDKVELNLKLIEVNGISKSAQERVGKIYQYLANTTNVAIDSKILKEAVSTPLLSYVPLIWTLWDSSVGLINVISPDKIINPNGLTLNLSKSLLYRPTDRILTDKNDAISTELRLARNTKFVKMKEDDTFDMLVNEDFVEEIKHSFKTITIDGTGMRLKFIMSIFPQDLKEKK